MKNKEVIVRILAPSEKPYLPKADAFPSLPMDKRISWQMRLTSAVSLTAIAATAFCLAFFLVKLGIGYKDIAVMIGMPLMFGMITRFAIR